MAASTSARRWPRDRRALALSLVLGAAAGAWVASRNRAPAANVAAPGEPLPLIDWEQARTIAVAMNRGAALTLPERTRLDAAYRDLVARCIPVVAAYTADTLPPTAVERTYAFDRVDWINANIAGFERMFAPLEGLNPASANGSVASMLWGGVNQKVVSAELGLLLGYLGRRVLGQYDLALLGREPVAAGKLYYVEPNIVSVERSLGLPPAEFRMWLALHETTHAFEFEAHPWLREHFNALLERYFEFLRQDAERLRTEGVRGLRVFVDRVRAGDRGDGSWLEALMTPEQRRLFAEMQAMMCVVEGYSNHVMNAVGKDLLPTYELISRKFEQRQRERTMAEQLFARLTGLDIKMEQYRLGEAFINRIAAERGHAFARRIWEGPDYLPSMDEIRHPDHWLARIDAMDRIAAGAEGRG
ncbi:MAG TPA: zinc-dependent metalloprotease [Thermomicrobiales bacterium]|nr:zinc-dependent metalloprotease [Thermomicrobiales bacterium]